MRSENDWKEIPGYPKYFCSKDGHFMKNGRMLKCSKHKSGYFNIRVYKDGKQKTFRAHRLVYMTWAGDIPFGFEVNHKNGNKSENSIFNLEICTHSENIKHAIDTGLLKIKTGADSKLSKRLFGKHLQNGQELHFDSQADARRAGFNQGCIQAVLAGKRNHHKGYMWCYS